MLQQITSQLNTWINIEGPTEKDVNFLQDKFTLHPSVLNRLIPRINRTETEDYKTFLFIILHFPIYDAKEKYSKTAELDVILNKNFIITIGYGEIEQLKIFFDNCNLHDELRQKYLGKSPAHLFYHLIDFIIDSRLGMLDHISHHIVKIEDSVFKGKEKEMLYEISIVKRDIIDFRKIIKPQRAVIEQTANKITKYYPFLGDERHGSEVIGSVIKLWHTLENLKEMIEAIEETNESLLTYKISEKMKILTAFSVILLPLALIANIFSLSIEALPLRNSPFGFPIVMTLMSISTIIMIFYFKKNSWL